MKLLKGRKTSNNKGMSLVELLCSVAILGIAITAISGAMIVSAQNYQKSNVEFDIQKEAQNATNLIGNLVVDAEEVKWEDYDADGVDDLVIYKGDVIYVVRFEQIAGAIGRLVYEEINKVDFSLIARGVLAEDVTGFNVDTAAFATNKNVKVDLKVKKDDKEYDASYNTTARNAEKTNATLGKYAKIEIEDEVILEPGQTYTFDVSVEGTALGLTYNMDSMPVETGWSGDSSHLTFKVLDSASGTYAFAVATNETDPNTGLALATETVTVHIRRVDSITWQNPIVNGASTSTISTFDAGTTYVLYADVACAGGNQYLDKGLNKAYDTHDDVNNDAYVNPRCIGFAYTTEGMSATGVTVEKSEDVNNPYVKITLNEEMPEGAKITITATAKHPNGMNKSSDPYTPSVVETYVISRPAIAEDDPYSPDNLIQITDGDIYRGFTWVAYQYGNFIQKPGWTEGDTSVMSNIINSYDGTPYTATVNWYFRYREVDTDTTDDDETPGAWTRFIKLSTGWFPTLQKAETQIFEPHKAYDIQFLVAFVDEDNMKLLWPTDSNLLDLSKNYGFAEKGFTAGWTGTGYDNYDESSVGFKNYGGTYRMDATLLTYFDHPEDNSAYCKIGYPGTLLNTTRKVYGGGVAQVGSEDSPLVLDASSMSGYYGLHQWFETSDFYREHSGFDVHIEYKNGTDWVDVTDSISSYFSASNLINTHQFFELHYGKVSGLYRVHMSINPTYAYYREVTSGDVLNELTVGSEVYYSSSGKTIHLCGNTDEDDEYGYLYFRY